MACIVDFLALACRTILHVVCRSSPFLYQYPCTLHLLPLTFCATYLNARDFNFFCWSLFLLIGQYPITCSFLQTPHAAFTFESLCPLFFLTIPHSLFRILPDVLRYHFIVTCLRSGTPLHRSYPPFPSFDRTRFYLSSITSVGHLHLLTHIFPCFHATLPAHSFSLSHADASPSFLPFSSMTHSVPL